MAIASISGVASILATRPVDSEHHPRDRKENADDKQHERERAEHETPSAEPDPEPEPVVDGEHHIHVIA